MYRYPFALKEYFRPVAERSSAASFSSLPELNRFPHIFIKSVSQRTASHIDKMSQSPSGDKLALEWLREAYCMRGRRFEWLERKRSQFMKDWMKHWEEMHAWQVNIERIIAEMKAEGDHARADAFATQIASDPIVSDPGNFRLVYPTGVGEEVIQIIGHGRTTSSPSGRLTNGAAPHEASAPVSPGRTEPGSAIGAAFDASSFLAHAEPVALGLEVERLEQSITFTQALEDKHWIFLTQSSSAFCLGCPCPSMPATVASGSHSGAHRVVPRRFHSNSLQGNEALVHFSVVHGEVFPGGLEEMIQRHGIKGKSASQLGCPC